MILICIDVFLLVQCVVPCPVSAAWLISVGTKHCHDMTSDVESDLNPNRQTNVLYHHKLIESLILPWLIISCLMYVILICIDVCLLGKESGPCKAAIVRWYYSVGDAACRQFYYGGCDGNGNNFGSSEECSKHCTAKVEPGMVNVISVKWHHKLASCQVDLILRMSWWMIMPSAHGPIFCRKELREKVRVKVRFFLRLSQRKRPTFCRKQLREKNRTDFFSDQKSADTDRLFIGAIMSDNSRRGLIVGWRHSDFLSDWSQRTRTDFLS